jgi:diguanylate cyclase (GGDEF)-like protein
LLNRRSLTHALTLSVEVGNPFTLLYTGLDGFKMVDDSSGHSTGDIILSEVANRLRNNNLSASTLCRFGGDEFIFAFYEDLPKQDLDDLLGHIIESISKPYQDSPKPHIIVSQHWLMAFS